MVFLKKRYNLKLIFIRSDKIFFIFNYPYYLNNFNCFTKTILWRSSAKHFLWSLRKFSSKHLSLSKKFFIKFSL